MIQLVPQWQKRLFRNNVPVVQVLRISFHLVWENCFLKWQMHFIHPNTKLEKSYFFNSSVFRFLWPNCQDCLTNMSCCQVSGSLSVLYLWLAISYSSVHLWLYFSSYFHSLSYIHILFFSQSISSTEKQLFFNPSGCSCTSLHFHIFYNLNVLLHSASKCQAVYPPLSLASNQLFSLWFSFSSSNFHTFLISTYCLAKRRAACPQNFRNRKTWNACR